MWKPKANKGHDGANMPLRDAQDIRIGRIEDCALVAASARPHPGCRVAANALTRSPPIERSGESKDCATVAVCALDGLIARSARNVISNDMLDILRTKTIMPSIVENGPGFASSAERTRPFLELIRESRVPPVQNAMPSVTLRRWRAAYKAPDTKLLSATIFVASFAAIRAC